ncbi:hypothetical protein GCM10011297_04640 [Bacterioplanes sanyensis]|nr:hypothetical protein GCM10011297_04640 [Bacterioplanes sanyensis]
MKSNPRALNQKFVYFRSEWKARVQGAIRATLDPCFASKAQLFLTLPCEHLHTLLDDAEPFSAFEKAQA